MNHRLAPALAIHQSRIRLLSAAFALFNSLRIVTHLPTLATIHASGKADQHSLCTWQTFHGANLTLAMWLYGQGGQRMSREVAVNLSNALMCGGIAASIAWLRWI